MANHNDLFQPESVNEQVEQLAGIQEPQQQESTPGAPTIAALQSIYKEDEALLERAWARIASIEAAKQSSGGITKIVELHQYRDESIMQETNLSTETSGFVRQSEPTFVRASERPRHTRQRRWSALSLIAAVLTAMVVVGSMFWMINASRNRRAITGATPKTNVQAISSAAVYVGGMDELLRVDAETGKVTWRYQIPSTTDPYRLLSFSQILSTDKVVYGLRQGIAGISVSVMAFDAQTGKVLWSHTMPGARSIALEHKTLYVGVDDANPQANKSTVQALDTSKGAALAKVLTFSGSAPQVSVVAGELYVATDTSISAIDLAHNKQTWRRSVTEMGLRVEYGHSIGYTVAHGTVYATYQNNHLIYLFALQASSGNKLWMTAPINVTGSSGGGYGVTAPVAGEGLVYFSTFGDAGMVFAYDAQKGRLVWHHETNAFIQSTPVFSGNTLYIAGDIISFGSPKTRFAALNGSTGELIWQTETKQGNGIPGFVLNGVVYVATTEQTKSTTFALRSSTGTQLWQTKLGGNVETLVGGGGAK